MASRCNINFTAITYTREKLTFTVHFLHRINELSNFLECIIFVSFHADPRFATRESQVLLQILWNYLLLVVVIAILEEGHEGRSVYRLGYPCRCSFS
jgi:hypothetical protein